jgi:hypothetical protein
MLSPVCDAVNTRINYQLISSGQLRRLQCVPAIAVAEVQSWREIYVMGLIYRAVRISFSDGSCAVFITSNKGKHSISKPLKEGRHCSYNHHKDTEKYKPKHNAD